MTRGIYKIYLGEPDIFYIGQSLNIEERVGQHKSLLKRNKHYNYKLQNTYNLLKVFEHTIEYIPKVGEHLYKLEEYYINKYNSITKGYNIASAGISGSGVNHPSNVYSKEQILEVMYLCLDPTNVYKDICLSTGVSVSTIRHIADRSVHYWLEDMFPEECAKLVHIRDNRLRSSSLRSKKIYKYSKLISPEGVIYSITNISAFGREHGLDSNKLGEIMRGTRNMHKGWHGFKELEDGS